MSPYRRILNGLQRLFRAGEAVQPASAVRVPGVAAHAPVIVPRGEHSISRQNLSRNAVRVLYTLHKAGYQAFMVGGGVRDVLMGHTPKDFDIATNAHPDEVKTLFRNCRLIGRRFRLAHVHFGSEIIEVATFRAAHLPEAEDSDEQRVVRDGLIVRDNVYGTFEEDAARRDFTINALYYNIADFSVVDFHHGMKDLRAGLIRLIGDPMQRYREDPVRMLRAVRFAAKLGFRIEEHTEAPIFTMGELLDNIPASRLFDEVQKLFLTGHAQASLSELQRYDLFRHLFSPTALCLQEDDEIPLRFLNIVCRNTDERVAQNQRVTPAFLFAAFLWYPFLAMAARFQTDDMTEGESLHEAGHEIFREQNTQVAVPKRMTLPIRDIWQLQKRMERPSGKRAHRLLHHPAFRAAYDFLLLRAEADPALAELAEWWQQLYHANETERQAMLTNPRQGQNEEGVKKRRRKRRKRKPAEEVAPPAGTADGE